MSEDRGYSGAAVALGFILGGALGACLAVLFAPESGRLDELPVVDGDALFDAGVLDSHGSCEAEALCDVLRAELGALLAVVDDDAVAPREPG